MMDIENTSAEFNKSLQAMGIKQFVVGQTFVDPCTAIPKALRQINILKPDIVQTNFINPLAIPLLKLTGVPIIYQTYHSGIKGNVSLKTRLIRIITSKIVTRVIAVSERVKRDEIRAGAISSKITVNYLGIPIEPFLSDVGNLRGQPPAGWMQPEIKKIITIGRFYPEKGMRYVTEAAVQVIKEFPDVIWWLVGKDGPEGSICREMVSKAGAGDRVFFLGERNDIPTLLNQAWLQVVGSLWEGLPLMILEASVLGVPTIGPNIDGINETVFDKKTGILVESGSSKGLANATSYLLNHPEIREQMGFSARSYIEEKFDANKHISKLIELYELDYNLTLKSK